MPSVWIETRKTPGGERYRVVWREVVFDAQGRPGKGRRMKGLQVSDPVRADKQKMAKIAELEDIEAGLKPKGPIMSWGEAAAQYLAYAEMRSPKSYRHLIKPAVDQFTAFVGPTFLADNIDAKVFIAYERHLRALEPKNKKGGRYEVNTIRRLLKDVRTAVRFAHNNGWTRHVPKLPIPRGRASERLPTGAEVDSLRRAVALEYRLPIWFLACTGFRLNEMLAVDGRDFRFNDEDPREEGYWEVKAQILKRQPDDPVQVKVLPLQPSLVRELGLPRPPGRVFKISAKGLQEAMARACEVLGIERISPHDLRHYWATTYMEKSGDMAGLMQMGGWKDADSVMRYQHLTRGRSKAILSMDFVRSDPEEPPRPGHSPSSDAVLRS